MWLMFEGEALELRDVALYCYFSPVDKNEDYM